MQHKFIKRVAVGVGQNQVSALLLANGYKGSMALANLIIIDSSANSVVLQTTENGSSAPGGTTGLTIGTGGSSESYELKGDRVAVPATNVWLYASVAHDIILDVTGY